MLNARQLSKGANLIQLRAKYDVRVDIPRRETGLAPPAGNATASRTGSPLPASDDDEEPTLPVSVTGPSSSVNEAINDINAIIAVKMANVTQRVRDIPAKLFPFIEGRKSQYEEIASEEGAYVSITLSSTSRELSASGDRPAVIKIIETVKANIQELDESLGSVSMTLPKPQHRLLLGDFRHELMESSKCVVSLPSDPDSKEVSIWGLQEDLPQGLQAVMKVSIKRLTDRMDYSRATPLASDF